MLQTTLLAYHPQSLTDEKSCPSLPTLRINNAGIYYEEQGVGPETVVFAHGFLWSCRMFDKQVSELKSQYRCVAFDFRGHGRSETTGDGYDMETLAKDAAGLIEGLHCAPCHFVGLSMGGFIGMRLAAERPELIRSLILFDTTADPETPENLTKYKRLSLVARLLGPKIVVGRIMPLMFGRTFLEDPARAEERNEWRKRMGTQDRVGITRAAMGVAKRQGVQEKLGMIRAPTLVVVGEQDVALPLEHSERLRQGISGSRLVVIPHAGHTSTVEEPQEVNNAILSFLHEH